MVEDVQLEFWGMTRFKVFHHCPIVSVNVEAAVEEVAEEMGEMYGRLTSAYAFDLNLEST